MNKMITTIIGFGSTMAVGLGFQPLNFSLKQDTYNPPRTNVIVKESQDNTEHSADTATLVIAHTITDTTIKENDTEKNKEKEQMIQKHETSSASEIPATSTTNETAEEQPDEENVQQMKQSNSHVQEALQAEKERPNMHASDVAHQAVEKEHAPEGPKNDKQDKIINVQGKDLVEVTVQLL